MKIKQEQIVGFQLLRNNKVVVKFEENTASDKFCEEYEDKTIRRLPCDTTFSSRAGVKEGEERVAVSQVPTTTRHGVEREEVLAQTITQDAVDPDGTTHPDCSENAVQETPTTREAKIHTERKKADQTKGKISYKNMEYDKADDMEATNMTGTECEVARGENKDRMEEIEEVTCIMSPSRNKDDANKKDQNKPGKN
ncbi:hypothetical protein Hamer_G006396, partial [Homarus americanus]